jgi:hypothetical protein
MIIIHARYPVVSAILIRALSSISRFLPSFSLPQGSDNPGLLIAIPIASVSQAACLFFGSAMRLLPQRRGGDSIQTG